MKVLYLGDLQTECTHESGEKILTEAPKDNEGKGRHFSPGDLLAASLGTCMVTLMGIAARKAGVDLKGLTAEIIKEMTSVPARRIGKLIIRFRYPHSLNQIDREKLEKAALECPVHRSLHPDIKLEFDFLWGI